ncbi:hypothetical protein ACSU6B_25730 [Neobacillus sp. C211]|uniref:hypothetical protein n=1 Tax=unclassified Neobacillus TaxID=2675272 RepID=UPI00397D8166
MSLYVLIVKKKKKKEALDASLNIIKTKMAWAKTKFHEEITYLMSGYYQAFLLTVSLHFQLLCEPL